MLFVSANDLNRIDFIPISVDMVVIAWRLSLDGTGDISNLSDFSFILHIGHTQVHSISPHGCSLEVKL